MRISVELAPLRMENTEPAAFISTGETRTPVMVEFDHQRHLVTAEWQDQHSALRMEYGDVYGGWDARLYDNSSLVAERAWIVRRDRRVTQEQWDWFRIGEVHRVVRLTTAELCRERWNIFHEDRECRRIAFGVRTPTRVSYVASRRGIMLRHLFTGIALYELMGRDTWGPT